MQRGWDEEKGAGASLAWTVNAHERDVPTTFLGIAAFSVHGEAHIS